MTVSSNLYYIRQTTDTCKGIKYPSKSHPYKYGKSGCIYTSGCGVCSTLMLLKNTTAVRFSTSEWTARVLKAGARSDEGTNMSVLAGYIKSTYKISASTTTDINALVTHLKKGQKAIINVLGGGKELFSNGGHYVFCGGIDTKGRLIILDPYWYEGKFTATANRRQYTTVKNDREVYVKPGDLKSDIHNIWLFTAPDKECFKYSANDVLKVKKTVTKKNKPTISDGSTFVTTRERGLYKGYGSDSGRRKYSDVVNNSNKAHIANHDGYAYYKKGTAFTALSHKTLGNQNLWCKTPSGYLCAYDYKPDTASIKK